MRKGMVLIMVVMIVSALFIMIAGIIQIVNSDSQITYRNISRTKLYYAAEAGAERNLKWLKNLSTANFLINKNAVSTAAGYSYLNFGFTINGASLRLSATVDTSKGYPVWTLISRAEKDGDACVITYANANAVSGLQYCNFTETDLYDNINTYFSIDQNWFGKSYWRGKVPLQISSGNKTPTFFGLTQTSSTKRSTKGNDTGHDYWYFPNQLLSFYKDGLNAYPATNSVNSASTLLDILNRAFRGGYESSSPEQEIGEMADSWSKITTSTLYPKAYVMSASFGAAQDVYLDFLSSEKVIIYRGGYSGTPIDTLTQGENNIIAVPNTLGNVHVRGVVTKDFSVITQGKSPFSDLVNNIIIEGDLYSQEFASYKSLMDNDFDATGIGSGVVSNIQKTVNKLQSVSSSIDVGLMAGIDSYARFQIASNTQTNTNNDAILVTAGLFVPKGRPQTGNYQKDGDLVAQVVSGNASPTSFSRETKLAVFGAFITKMGEGWTLSGNKGVNPTYMGDPKFMAGSRAPGFLPSSAVDYLTSNSEYQLSNKMKWSISWE